MQLFQNKKIGVLRNAVVTGARTIEVPEKIEEEDKTFKPMNFTNKSFGKDGEYKN